MHPDFFTIDPLRTPAWRMERVRILLEGNGERSHRPTRWDDKYVRAYLQFLKDYEAAYELAEAQVANSGRSLDDAPALYQLFGEKAGLWLAHRMYTSPDSQWRAILEARILAREDDRQIAERFETIPEMVFWYEKLFFNVRDRLDCPDWITKTIRSSLSAMTPRSDGGMTEAQRDYVYKSFGYFGRSLALDAVLSSFGPEAGPARGEDVEAWTASTLKFKAKVQALVAMLTFDVNKFNVMQLLDLALRTVEADAGDGQDEKRHTALEAAVANLVAEVPWELGLIREAVQTPLERQFSGAVEPRADEQLLIAAGVEPPGLREYCDQVEQDD